MDRSRLQLSFRCDEPWDGMAGDARRRHCARCAKDVVDLSARTELGARLTLAVRKPACVRYTVRPDGRVRFRPSRLARVVAALAALAAAPAMAAPAVPPTVQMAPGEGAIRLFVTDETDLPVPGAQLDFTGPDGTIVTVVTDAFGQAVVAAGPGAWTVDVTKMEFTGQKLTNVMVTPGRETRLPVQLNPSSYVGDIGWISYDIRFNRSEPDLPAGGSSRTVYAAPGRWRRAVLKCVGYGTYLHRSVVGGVAWFDGIPTAAECRARLHGWAPPVRVQFGPGETRVRVPGEDPDG